MSSPKRQSKINDIFKLFTYQNIYTKKTRHIIELTTN